MHIIIVKLVVHQYLSVYFILYIKANLQLEFKRIAQKKYIKIFLSCLKVLKSIELLLSNMIL